MDDPHDGIDEGVDSTAARGALRLVAERHFGPYFAAKMLSSIGVWIYTVVAAVVVFELTGSAFFVGVVSAAQFLPQLALAPFAGARADRGDRLRQLALARAVVAGGSGVLALWAGFVGLDGSAGATLVIAMAFVVGTDFAVGDPAMHAMIPALVRPSELSAAIALNQTPFTLGRAAGPALGALILTLAGPG